MSFFCAVPFEDHIDLLTDGAVYTPSGRLVTVVCKATVSPHMPMAITTRGVHGFGRELTAALIEMSGQHKTFADTMNAFGERMHKWVQNNPKFAGRSFQMMVCGFDPNVGPCMVHMTDVENLMWPGVLPMVPQQVQGVQWGGPDVSPEVRAHLEQHVFTEAQMAEGVTAWGPILSQVARMSPDYLVEDVVKGKKNRKKQYLVGGHIDRTRIDQFGATTSRLLTWPDRRLRKIDASLPYTLAPTVPRPVLTPEMIETLKAAAASDQTDTPAAVAA